MRLYFGSYLSEPPLARAIPSRNSGTNWLGSLTNFFTPGSPSGAVLGAPCGADGLENHADGGRTGVDGIATSLAGVRGPAAHGEHALGVLGGGDRHVCRLLECCHALVGDRLGEAGLKAIDGWDERVEERLLAERRVAAGHDPLHRRMKHGDEVLRRKLGPVARGDAGSQEGGAPERAAGPTHL